jgi:hypothetical protein
MQVRNQNPIEILKQGRINRLATPSEQANPAA